MIGYKRSTTLSIVVLMTCITLHAQTAQEITDKFLDFSLDKPDMEIKARLFVPENYDPDSLYPVVMTLHGSGESGTDNEIQVRVNHMATSWGKDDFQAENPCFIFSPQCPNSGLGWSNKGVYDAVMYLLDSLVQTYAVDTTRIYLTGLSMGGNGTWSYLTKDPELYAAAIPVCGWISGNTETATASVNSFGHVPVWNFHGASDNIVQTNASRFITGIYYHLHLYPIFTHAFYRYRYDLDDTAIQRLIDNYTEVLYAEVPGIGHNVWDVAYQTPLAQQWLFNQRLHYPDALILENDEEEMQVSGEVTFHYSNRPEVDSITVWISELNDGVWNLLDKVAPDGSYTFDSSPFEDHPFRILRFMAHDSAGHAIGKDFTPLLRINNEGNGAPHIVHITDPTIRQYSINLESFKFEYLVADPELDPLHLEIYTLNEAGDAYEMYATRDVDAGIVTQEIQLTELPYSDSMVIQAIISDGTQTDTIESMDFRNRKGYVQSVQLADLPHSIIYPNPVDGQLFIELPDGVVATVEVRDTRGSLVRSQASTNGKMDLNTENWLPGVYLLNVRKEGEIYSTKVVKH